MLMSRPCPYTGVVNFYDASEPHFSIGSITKCKSTSTGDGFAWRFYGYGQPRAGRAPDAGSAEKRLRALAADLVYFTKRDLH